MRSPRHLSAYTHLLVAVDLDIAHGLQHNVVTREVYRLHIEERRHVAVERYMRLTERVGELFGEVTREIDDTVNLLIAEQLFRLRYGGTGMREPDIRRGIPFMQELPTLRAVGQVHHGHRHVRYLLVPINGFVDERVHQRRHDEDDHHARVTENAEEFINERFYYRVLEFGHFKFVICDF